jgi:hypothetical protein
MILAGRQKLEHFQSLRRDPKVMVFQLGNHLFQTNLVIGHNCAMLPGKKYVSELKNKISFK